MPSPQASESFNNLLLRHRGRSGLTQRELAERVGVNRRSVQEWENGANYPSAERLEALIQVLLEAHGLTPSQETAEAHAVWAAVLRDSPRTHAPFDQAWFAELLAQRSTPADAAAGPASAAAAASRADPSGPPLPRERMAEVASLERRQDWGEAPDTNAFVGRAAELQTLRRWVVDEHCRLVAILGMGGMGKTSLAARLAQQVAQGFERVYWRSLRDALPTSDWLAGAIGFLSDQQLVPPAADSERLPTLLQLLRERRCLLVLDNFETLFESGQSEQRYRAGMAGYGRLLRAVGEASHQGCLVLTSREAPPEFATLGSDSGFSRALGLDGLSLTEGRALLDDRELWGDDAAWADLVVTYAGNSLALKVVGGTIRELFGGDIAAFITYIKQTYGSAVRSIRRVLEGQVERRLSRVELSVLRWLAVAREPVLLATLMRDLGPSTGRGAVLEAVEALRRRSLLERAETPGAAAFTLQSVVLEYVTDRLVEAVSDEVERGQPDLLVEQPLIQAQAKEYVRQSQERLIGAPILQHLKAQHGEEGTQGRLLGLLDNWRDRSAEKQGYGPGNVVNLLRLQQGELRGLDLSRLTLRQAYLAQVEAQDASLAGAHLVEPALSDAFGSPLSVALSADGAFLAAGTAGGELWLWEVADRRLLLTIQGHTGAVMGVALSDDGLLVASADAAGMVRLWDTRTAQLLAALQGPPGGAWGVALSADGRQVASSDTVGGMVCVWDTSTGRPLATAQGHTGGVWSLAFSRDRHLLASGSGDTTVRLWDTSTGESLATLQGHTGGVRGVTLSANGELLASGSEDGTVRLWQARTGEVLAILEGHTSGVWSVALSADGRLVASGGGDAMVRLWDTSTGQPLRTLHGHTVGVVGVALSADGELLASASEDATVRLWETATGRVLGTLQGHAGAVWSVALSADGSLLASGGGDAMVRLWDTTSGRPLAALEGHTSGVRHVALSANGHLVASGGWDGRLRLWEAPGVEGDAADSWQGRGARVGLAPAAPAHGGPRLVTLDHAGEGVALSADGQLLASYWRVDRRVRLCQLPSGELLATIQAHQGPVWHAALSSSGDLLATGGADGSVRLWEVPSGRPLATLQAHPSGVSGVALSADGRLVAGTNSDGTVRLWETRTGRLLAVLDGHNSAVLSVALSADGRHLASGGGDGTVCLWLAPGAQHDSAEQWAGAGESSAGPPATPARWTRPTAILRGHTGAVWRVALSADGRLLASGSWDGTIRLWEAGSATCLRVLRPDRRYERLDITGLSGITEAQRAALLALGAIEQHSPAAEQSTDKPLVSTP